MKPSGPELLFLGSFFKDNGSVLLAMIGMFKLSISYSILVGCMFLETSPFLPSC